MKRHALTVFVLALVCAGSALASRTGAPEAKAAAARVLKHLDNAHDALSSYRIPVRGLVTACKLAKKLPAGRLRENARLAIVKGAAPFEARLSRSGYAHKQLEEADDGAKELSKYASGLTEGQKRVLGDLREAAREAAQTFDDARDDLLESLVKAKLLECSGGLYTAQGHYDRALRRLARANGHYDDARHLLGLL